MPRGRRSSRKRGGGGVSQRKRVVATDQSGVVKCFYDVKGYGFISPDDGSPDVFFHHSGIVGNDPRMFVHNIAEGDVVWYDLVTGPKGYSAASVEVTEDETTSSGSDVGESSEEEGDRERSSYFTYKSRDGFDSRQNEESTTPTPGHSGKWRRYEEEKTSYNDNVRSKQAYTKYNREESSKSDTPNSRRQQSFSFSTVNRSKNEGQTRSEPTGNPADKSSTTSSTQSKWETMISLGSECFKSANDNKKSKSQRETALKMALRLYENAISSARNVDEKASSLKNAAMACWKLVILYRELGSTLEDEVKMEDSSDG